MTSRPVHDFVPLPLAPNACVQCGRLKTDPVHTPAMREWQRTVTYSVRAHTVEKALEIWEDQGPETGTFVVVVDDSPFEATDRRS